jgi:hypothetical protein
MRLTRFETQARGEGGPVVFALGQSASRNVLHYKKKTV